MNRRIGFFAGISLLVTSPLLISGSAYAGEDLVPVQVLHGENLMDVIRRTHPCPFKAGDNSLQKVMHYNSETVGADGKFTLTQKEIQVPRFYLESAASCRAIASSAPVAHAAAVLQAEGHQSGGGEAVIIEPKELSEREHGNETDNPNVLRLGTFLEYTKLSSNSYSGSSADLTSKPEYGFDLEYDRWINRAFFVGGHFRFAHTAFQELEERELQEDSTSAKAFGVTAGYDLGKKTIVTMNVSAAQIDHVVPDVDTVSVEHVWVPKLTFGVKSVFAEVANFEIGGGISGSLYLPARGIAKTSPAESAEVFVEREFNHFVSAELGFGAQFVRQGFVDESHSSTSYGADFGIGIHF